ncbi:hypothetical protein HYU10_02655 [Candidatus Woesearchaeota archaeon]|nr:hypothetical protein [Candidatus Woesearchaeota archaeon]
MGYDREGKFAGSWFKAGRDRNRPDYWVDALSIVYDHIDPTQIRVSIGDFGGYPKAFGVKGNSHEPAQVSKDSGMTKYELVTFDYVDSDGKMWDAIHFAEGLTARNTEIVMGVALFQILDDRTLKAEVFPGKTASQITDFTEGAATYIR